MRLAGYHRAGSARCVLPCAWVLTRLLGCSYMPFVLQGQPCVPDEHCQRIWGGHDGDQRGWLRLCQQVTLRCERQQLGGGLLLTYLAVVLARVRDHEGRCLRCGHSLHAGCAAHTTA